MLTLVLQVLGSIAFYLIGMCVTFVLTARSLVRNHGQSRFHAINNAWEHARWWPLYMLVAPVWALRDFMESRVPESEKERKRRLRDLERDCGIDPQLRYQSGSRLAQGRGSGVKDNSPWLPGVVWPEPEPAQPPGSLIVDGKRETVDPPEQS